ncbi:acyl-CoA thioesterase [Xanthobacter agilis]|uniref:Acyl-CoA hydrolase n=1 Tax=Xanthobacter agilis TaxID=47492 RepID=A0ABU0LK89_XANAG|nr:acyl-CoA hydrolase [Xanthobacter agilis]
MDAPASALPRDIGAGAAPGPSQTSFVEMVFPDQANHYGTLFGGNALSLMGKAAFVAATRRARTPVVMASADKTEFHVPVRVGEIVELCARVTRVGRTSMTVEVEMTAEALLSGARRLAVRGVFEMVAVDASGRPMPVPSLSVQSKDQSS